MVRWEAMLDDGQKPTISDYQSLQRENEQLRRENAQLKEAYAFAKVAHREALAKTYDKEELFKGSDENRRE